MTSHPRSSRRLVVPLALGVVALVVVVAFAASVLSTPRPTPTPVPRITDAPIVQASPTPAPTPTEEPSPTDSPSPSPAPLPSAPPAIVTATLQRSSGAIWTVRFRYPKIAPGTSPFADEIDSQIASYVATTVTAWTEGPAAVAPPAGGHPNSLEGSYSVALVTPGLLSFRMQQVEDLNGAHPSTTLITQTYDLTTGQLVGTGDIFADQQGALAIISEKARESLKSQLGSGYEPNVADEGTRPDNPDNFAAWALTTEGLEITFQEYQVGPSAVGLPVVVVPWSDLKNVLDPGGPVASLIGG